MSTDIEFADDDQAFINSQQFQDIKSWTHDHLLSRIEELGAEFGRWSRASIQQFVELEVDSFVRLRRVPINDREMQLISDALTKELAGFGAGVLRRLIQRPLDFVLPRGPEPAPKGEHFVS